jgi:hypothetical protein
MKYKIGSISLLIFLALTFGFDPISIVVLNGGMTTGISVSDQVTITYDNKILRLKSPDLKRWIETDMSRIIEDRLKEQQKQGS